MDTKLKGILHQKILSLKSHILDVVMGCGIANFGGAADLGFQGKAGGIRGGNCVHI